MSAALRGPAVAALVAVLVSGAALARAEVAQQGNLRISVAARLSPKRLPRRAAAPVAVSVAGAFASGDGSLVPQLEKMKIELNRQGRLDTVGLPECKVARIQPASTARALAACRAALVGRGSFTVQVVLGGGEPYPTVGRLLVFNGRYRGRPALLGQIYSAHPFASSFVIPFLLQPRRHGRYGTLLSATLPRAFTGWGHVTGLTMHLARRYSYRGERRSFISAACPAPKGFPGATFPLARTSFSFAGGKTLSETLTGSCRVRG